MLHFKTIEPTIFLRRSVFDNCGSTIGIYTRTLDQYEQMANEKFGITRLIREKLKHA